MILNNPVQLNIDVPNLNSPTSNLQQKHVIIVMHHWKVIFVFCIVLHVEFWDNIL